MNESRVVFLRGLKTVLRPISKDDIPNMVRWVNDPEIRRMVTMQTPMTVQSEEEWVSNLSKRPLDVILAIETLDGQHIGTIGLHSIDFINRRGSTGTIIGEKEFQSKSFGTDAKMTLLDYAFNTLNLHKICSGAIAYNERSVKYSLRCGYKIEGRRPAQFFRDGKYQDEILLGVFRSDFEQAYAAYQIKMQNHLVTK